MSTILDAWPGTHKARRTTSPASSATCAYSLATSCAALVKPSTHSWASPPAASSIHGLAGLNATWLTGNLSASGLGERASAAGANSDLQRNPPRSYSRTAAPCAATPSAWRGQSRRSASRTCATAKNPSSDTASSCSAGPRAFFINASHAGLSIPTTLANMPAVGCVTTSSNARASATAAMGVAGRAGTGSAWAKKRRCAANTAAATRSWRRKSVVARLDVCMGSSCDGVDRGGLGEPEVSCSSVSPFVVHPARQAACRPAGQQQTHLAASPTRTRRAGRGAEPDGVAGVTAPGAGAAHALAARLAVEEVLAEPGLKAGGAARLRARRDELLGGQAPAQRQLRRVVELAGQVLCRVLAVLVVAAAATSAGVRAT
jgi:hypothetical protein